VLKSALGIHGDTNRNKKSDGGTSGCIGLLKQDFTKNMSKLEEFTKNADHKKIRLYVDY